MKKNILLLDDDPLIHSFVQESLKGIPLEIYSAYSCREAIDLLQTHSIDAAILDVHLSYEESGVRVAKLLNETKEIPFLFLTAHSDDMVTGMLRKYDAHAHLIKPVNPRQLFIEVSAMLCKENQPKESSKEQFLTIRVKGERIVIRQEDILYLEAEGNYSRIFTYEDKFTVSKTLKVLSQWLPEEFFIRINRSYLVNIRSIRKVATDKVQVVNGHVLPMSRNLYKEVMNHFINI